MTLTIISINVSPFFIPFFVTLFYMRVLQIVWQAKCSRRIHRMAMMATWENNFPNQKCNACWPRWSWGQKYSNSPFL